MKRDEGVAGLKILLSMVVMLFVIGFLVMIYALVVGEAEEEAWATLPATAVGNETNSSAVNAAFVLAGHSANYGVTCTSVFITNFTGGEEITGATNYSTDSTGCTIIPAAASTYNLTSWNVSYTYSGFQNSSASIAIEDMTDELNATTNWFTIIIVLGAIVVLIMLTVMIITTLKNSGVVNIGGKGPTATA